MPQTATVRLKPRREKPFLDNAHPWVMSGAVGETHGPAEAPLARVETADGRPVGLGFHSPGSQIRVRLLGRKEGRLTGILRGLLGKGSAAGQRRCNCECAGAEARCAE